MTLQIAVVVNYLPAPANWGSALRTYYLARGLARVGRVTLYCRTSEEEAAQFTGHPDLAPYARVRYQTWPRKAYAGVFRVFSAESMAVWMADSDPLTDRLRADHALEPYDVLVSMQLFGANVARQLAPVPWVLDAHDVVDQAQAQLGVALRAVPHAAEQAPPPAVHAYEINALRTADLVTCVTEADADYVRAHSQPTVRVVRNGAVVCGQPFTPPSLRAGLEVLFMGAFFWPPSAKAARFLAREVMPLVWREEPAARLVICGRSPGIDVALLQRRGIEVTGTVPSVRPYLDRAAVFANALFEGAGSSLKVAEVLASGVPLISTAVGVRGYPLIPGRHYVAAEDADGFAQAILAQFRDRGAADERARAGRAFAEAYDWDQIGQEFAAAVAQVAQRA